MPMTDDEAVDALINVLGLAHMLGVKEMPLPIINVRDLAIYTRILRKGIREVCTAEDGTMVSREVREKLLALVDATVLPEEGHGE